MAQDAVLVCSRFLWGSFGWCWIWAKKLKKTKNTVLTYILASFTFRPKEFAKATYDLSDSEEESNVGKMPPSDSDDE